MENSMEDFPEGSMKEEDSMMDVEDLDTTGEDYPEFRAQLSTPVSAADQCKIVWCHMTGQSLLNPSTPRSD